MLLLSVVCIKEVITIKDLITIYIEHRRQTNREKRINKAMFDNVYTEQ